MKFKRFLSLLLALTLVLSYVPVGAFATETGDEPPIVSEETPNETPSETPSETPDGDAEIEQIADEPTVKTVATEAELAAALAEGGDIKLETQKMGDMYMPLNVSGILTVPADKTVNLDLNGITVMLNDQYLVNEGTLTVKNGTLAASIFNDTTNGAAIYNKGTLVVDGANVSGVCAAIRTESGKVTVNGGTISATENSGKTAALLRVKGGEVVINGGTFVGCNSTNGNEGCLLFNVSGGSVVVNGGHFSDFAGQTMPSYAQYVTISAGTFVPGTTDGWSLAHCLEGSLAPGYEVNADGAVVKTPITGTITPAFTSSTGFWGEGGGNALESYVVTLYEGDKVIATATLNNIGGIINGNVYVTWNIPFAASNDEYWTVVWANGYPNADMAPTKVTLTLDGNVVAENNHKWNAPDDLGKIVAKASQDGVFVGYFASLADAVAAGNEVTITAAGSYAVPSGKDCTITGAVDGVVFDNIGACGMHASVTFNNVTFDYYPNTNYTGLQHAGTMVYNNCTFNGQVFLYGQSETFNNCTFNQNSADAYNVWTYGAKEVAFNECTFNSAGKSVLIYSEQSDLVNNVTVTESTFNATAAVDGKAAIEMDSSLTSGINLTIDAATTATGFGNGNVSGNSLWNNKKGNETAENNDVTVVVNNETVLKPIVLGLSGEGTAASPYLINNLDELLYFAEQVNGGNNYQGKVVKLNADINLGGMEWTPISTFNGVFDGGDHIISNLVITGNKSNAGFFGQTNNGEIKNLTFNNAKVSGYLNVGVVAGTPYTSKYTNIKVTGHVEVNGYAYVGGVGGKNAYANWTDITVDVDSTSYVKAESEGYRTYVGGVIGFNGEGGHTFKNISSNIAVIGSTADIGGIFGIAHYGNKFENITFTGSVTAPEDAIQVGGIAGVWHNEKGTSVSFSNVTSTGTVTVGDETTTGSIVGDAYNASNDSVENSGSLVIDGSEAWLKVVSIGETKYSSLAAAIEEVEENGTITLLVDLEFNKYNYMVSSGSWYEGLYYTGDKSFTLDLNGKTVTCTADVNDYMFNIKNMGEKANEITIKNGTITGGTSVWSVLCVGSSAENQATTVNLENVTINAGTQPNWGDLAVKVRGASVVNVKSGTKIVGQSGTTYVVAAEGDAVLNVYEGAEITACAANAPAVSGNSTVNIYGGTITATNGAFAVYTYSTGDPVVNISGGTINGDVYAHADVTSDANAIATVNISGGTINGKLLESYYGTPTTVCSEISVSGGIFSEDVSAYCADGYVCKQNTDGTYGIKAEREAWILRNGVIRYYGSLAEAVADAKDGETIILQANVEIAEVITIDKNITIGDYGNLTITPAGEGAFYLKGAAQLTLNNLIVKETPVFTDNSETGAAINGQVVTGVVTQKSSVSYDGTTVTVVNPAWVAKIGTTYYMSINEALTAAQPGDTVVILAGEYSDFTINKAITVVGETDANGNNLVTVNGRVKISGNGITLKNVTVKNPDAKGSYDCAVSISGKDILIEGCDISGYNGTRWCYTSGLVTFKDSKIAGENFTIHFDGSAGGEIVIDNCDITGWTSYGSSIKNITMTDSTFAKGNYSGIRLFQENIVIDNCTFENGMKVDIGVKNANVTMTDSTNGGDIADLFNGIDIVESSITVDGEKLVRVARVASKYFETVEEAFAAVQNGGTIELYADVTMQDAYDVNNFELNIIGSGKLTLNEKLTVSGESILNISAPMAGEVILNNGAILKDSTISGNVFVAGKVIFRGDNTVNMLYDYGTLTDYYGTVANMEWSVEPGASLTMAAKARYGLGYGDNITIKGELTDAMTARDTLTKEEASFFTHGLVAQESKGWNCDSSLTVEDAYVIIGENNSFGNKPGNYGGTYTFNFENTVLDASRITFYEALSTTEFNLTGTDAKIGQFMIRDKDSVFTLTNSKLLSTSTVNGNDEGNYIAGKLVLANSELTYSSAMVMEDGTIEMDLNSSITAPAIKGAGKIVIDATGFNGAAAKLVAADLSEFTGEVEVIGAAYKVTNDGIVIEGAVASIGDAMYATLAEAIANVKNGETIELLAAIDEDVTVVQAPDVKITIDGKGNTFSGTITVDGKSAAYATAALTIQNVKFDATDISKDASINLGGSNATRYTSNVSVIDCSFAGEGQTKVGIKSYTGGCKNLSVTGCSATGMHSLMQLYKTTGLVVDDCTVTDSKNGISVRSSEGTITNCTIDVDGYGVRADGDSVSTLTVSGNTIDAAKPVIVRKTTADGYKLAVDGNTLTAPAGEYQVIITKGEDDEAPVDPSCKFVFEGNTDDLSVYPCDLYVAEINGKGYMTINEALTAAQPGDEVVIFAGTYAQGLSVTKDITVIGEGEVNFNGKLSISGDGATVKGLNFNNGGSSAGYIGAKDVLVEDCTVVGGNGFRNCYTSGTVTFKDSTITGATYGIHFDGSAGGEIVIDNCVITGWTSFAASIKKVTMTDTTFAEGNYNYIRFYQDADIDNCTFNEKMSVDISNSVSATVKVTNSTLENGNVEELFSAADIDKSDIYVDGELLITPAAEINGVVYDTLAEALAAVQAGDNTITLVADLDEDVIIEQIEGINITIDGDNHVYTGTMEIYGHARYNGEETLTIKNVKFETSEAKHDFITCNTTESVKRYAHNVTVEGCSFTATGDAVNSAVGLRLRQCYDILVKNSTATGLHSLIQATGGNTMVIDTVTVDGCKNGIAAGTTDGVTVKNSTINVAGYGVRADGNAASDMTVSGNTITAAQPVVVRRTTAAYDLTVTGNTLNAPEGAYQVVITEGEDDAAYVNPTGAFALASDVDTNKVYPAAAYAAQVGDYSYTSVEAALEAAENDDTVIILKDLTMENTIVVTKSVTIDLNGQTLTGSCNPVIRVKEANVTVQGGNIVNNEGYCFIVGSTDASGELTIKSGNFRASTTVASVTKGYLTIEGGYFAVDAYSGEGYENYNYLLNCIDAYYKTGEAGITVKGGSFENFNPADNAAEGLGTNFVDPLYEATTTNGVVWNVNAYGAGEIPENPIYVEWIWNDEMTEATATVSVPANATYYFAAYGMNGTVLTVNGEELEYVPGFMFFTPATFEITNGDAAEATYELKISYPIGSQNNPAELVIGDNTATIEAGNDQGYFFTYTAPADGVLTITMPEGGWTYVINNLTTYQYGDMQWSDSDPVVNPAIVEFAAGDELQVIVNTYDPATPWSAPAGDVTFNVAEGYPVGHEMNPIFLFAQENDVTQSGETWYQGYFSGMIMTVEGQGDFSVIYNGVTTAAVDGKVEMAVASANPRMPVIFAVVGDGEFGIDFTYPVGNMNNPAELVIGDNTAAIDAGSQGYYYTWTAEEDGELVITMPETGWMYVMNNMTTGRYGDMQWSDSDPVVNPGVIAVNKGDEVQVTVSTYDPANPWNAPAGELTVSAEFVAAPGTEVNPIGLFDQQNTVTAEGTSYDDVTYYFGYFNNMILTVEGEGDFAVIYNGESVAAVDGKVEMSVASANPRMPVNFAIDGNGDYAVNVSYPVGNMENAAQLVIGNNTASIEAGNFMGYFFSWTADKDGVLIITMPEGDWMYAINNLTAYQYGDTQWSDSDPVVNPAYVNVSAGDEIQIMVNSYDPANMWSNPAAEITFVADFMVPVAMNETTGEIYGSVAEALATAKAGQTVVLTADASEDMIFVRSGITLDLNGYTLTASDVAVVNSAHIVDNSADNAGLLVVDSNHVMISRDNKQLPVRNGNGYIFVDVDVNSRAFVRSETVDGFTYMFQPIFEEAARILFADGAADNELTIEVRVSWDTEKTREYRNLVFNEDQIKAIIGAAPNGAFVLNFSGFETVDAIGGATVETVINTVMGVSVVSNGHNVDFIP